MTGALHVIVNAGGGAAAKLGERLAEQVEAAFSDAGPAITLHAADGREIPALVERHAARGRPIVVGGGDGTLGCAAGAIAAAGATLGILPLGTRNHLARELGIPLDLPGAAKVIVAGSARAIDLGALNGHSFVNNASIGLYPRMVRERDARDLPKWIARFPAAWAAFREIRHHRLRLTLDGSAEVVRTPLLFVGNNIYSLEAGRIGEREALDEGRLSVFAVASHSRAGLIGFALRTLAGRSDPDRDFASLGACARLRVEAGGRSIDVALDGEVIRLPAPLDFTIRPGALKVLAPPRKPAGEGKVFTRP